MTSLHPRVSAWLLLAVGLVAYNLKFIGVPGSTVYLGIGLLVVLARSVPLQLRRFDFVVLLAAHLLFVGFSVLRWWADGTSVVLTRGVDLLVFGVPTAMLLAAAARFSASVVLRAVVYVTAVQGVMVFATYTLPSARSLVARTLVQSGSISLLYGGRPSGFTNSSGSLLAVTQAVGACAGLVWLLSFRRRAVPRRLHRHVVTATVISILSSVISGRTGVIVLAIFLLGRSLRHPKVLLGGAALVAGSIVALLSLPSLLSTSSSLYAQAVDSRHMVLDLLKLWRGQFFDVYRTMPYPGLGTNLILGDPHYFDPGAVTHDSGVVQTIGSVGVPAALLVYGSIAWFAAHRRPSYLVGWTTMCWTLLLLEMKEPFIFKGPNLVVVLAVGWCLRPTTTGRPSSAAANGVELVGPTAHDGAGLEVARSAP